MTKRPFIRRDGLLFDSYLLPDGRKCTGRIPGHVLGEPLEAPQRERALALLQSETDASIAALSDQSSPQHLDALLAALRLGNIAAPMALVRYVDDPRVRPALVEAASLAPNGRATNHLQVLGMVGGVGAIEVLKERVEWLSEAPGTWKDNPFFNPLAGDLSTASHALLNLDVEAIDAAQAFARLFAHVCAFNRRSALREGAEAFRKRPSTEAMEILRQALLAQMQSDDSQFSAALGALLEITPEAAIARCQRLLRDSNWEISMAVVNRLSAKSNLELPGVRALLGDWVRSTSDLENALGVAGEIRSSLPDEVVESLIARSLSEESPSLRWRGVTGLAWIGQSRRQALAAQALDDEPDPALRRMLSTAGVTP